MSAAFSSALSICESVTASQLTTSPVLVVMVDKAAQPCASLPQAPVNAAAALPCHPAAPTVARTLPFSAVATSLIFGAYP